MRIIALVVFCAAVFQSLAINHVPNRARGGELWKNLVSAKKLHSFPPQTWNAPVDHFDSKNNATFLQRLFFLLHFMLYLFIYLF
jgi:hypothetical protein